MSEPELIRVNGVVYRLAVKVTSYEEGVKLFGQLVQQIAEKAKAKGGKMGKDPEDGVVIDILNKLGAEVGKAVQAIVPQYQQLKDPARKKQIGELAKTALLGSITKLLEEYKTKAEGGGEQGDLYSELQTMLPRFTKALTDKMADGPAKAAKYIQELQAKYGQGVSTDPADPIYPRLGKLVEIATQMSKLKA